jgi:hypothetical protein
MQTLTLRQTSSFRAGTCPFGAKMSRYSRGYVVSRCWPPETSIAFCSTARELLYALMTTVVFFHVSFADILLICAA